MAAIQRQPRRIEIPTQRKRNYKLPLSTTCIACSRCPEWDLWARGTQGHAAWVAVGVEVEGAVRERAERARAVQVVYADRHRQLTTDEAGGTDRKEAEGRDGSVEGSTVQRTRCEIAAQHHDVDEVREGHRRCRWGRERVRVQVLLCRRNKQLERVRLDTVCAGALVVLRDQARLARLDLVRVGGDEDRLIVLPGVQHRHLDAVDEHRRVVFSRQHSEDVARPALGKRHQEEGCGPGVRRGHLLDDVVASKSACWNVQAGPTSKDGDRLVRLDQRASEILAGRVAQKLIHIELVESNAVRYAGNAATRRRAGRDSDGGVVLGRHDGKKRSSSCAGCSGPVPKRDVLGAKHVDGQAQESIGSKFSLTQAVHDDVARGRDADAFVLDGVAELNVGCDGDGHRGDGTRNHVDARLEAYAWNGHGAVAELSGDVEEEQVGAVDVPRERQHEVAAFVSRREGRRGRRHRTGCSARHL
mmetsp:Transcript_16764/g.63762  ORF Transcript_16764/g.63762 Transcript_16764/m.63762 type:complete len:472 (+) Transcript_16764:191-1606(+)